MGQGLSPHCHCNINAPLQPSHTSGGSSPAFFVADTHICVYIYTMVIHIHIIASPILHQTLSHLLSAVAHIRITDLEHSHLIIDDGTLPNAPPAPKQHAQRPVIVLGTHIVLPTTIKKLVAYVDIRYRQYKNKHPIIWQDFTLYPEKNLLYNKQKYIQFTALEGKIMATLMTRDSIDKDDLLHTVWGIADGVHTHTAHTHISRIRKKISALSDRLHIQLTPNGLYTLQYTP